MPILHGKGGTVTIGGSTVGVAYNWEITVEQDAVDVSHFGTDWRENIIGLRGWTGTVDCRFDVGDAGLTALQNAILGTSPATVSLSLATGDGATYSGSAIINSETLTVNVEDAIEASFDFTGTGALSKS